MNGFVVFWIILVVLAAVGIMLSGEGFSGYAYMPIHSRGGWRWPRGGWRWPRGGWGRYGWGVSPGYDPRVNYVSYIEPFIGAPAPGKEPRPGVDSVEDRLIEFPPNAPAEVIKSAAEPYQLLTDVLPSMGPPENLSKITAESCFMGNFGRLLEPTGNFRQMSNNYKHGYPDSCSSPFHELVTPFYKGGYSMPSLNPGCI